MNPNYLDFEQPIADLEAKIQEMRHASTGPAVNIDAEVHALQDKLRLRTAQIFRDLTPWQVSQLARHPARPYTNDYIRIDLRRIPGARRRPRLRRRRRDRRRPRPHRRPQRDDHRPPEGPRHQGQGAAQLRHAAPGGLPQGAAADEDGRAFRLAAADLHRHARRLSRHRRRGTRPVRGDRAQPAWRWPS